MGGDIGGRASGSEAMVAASALGFAACLLGVRIVRDDCGLRSLAYFFLGPLEL